MRKLLPLILAFISSFSYGQVTFRIIPMDSELVARNLITNSGTINVAGWVNKIRTPYDSICLKIYRNNILIDILYQGLNYSRNYAPFNFTYQIPAELKEYKLSVFCIKKATQTLDTTINGIVAGDVYIIEGQSNALAAMRDREAQIPIKVNSSVFLAIPIQAQKD